MNNHHNPPVNHSANAMPWTQALADKAVFEYIDLNEILLSAVQKYSEEMKNLIFRYDKLPVAYGSKNQFTQLVDALVCMIINHPPSNSKLFLYIKSEEQVNDSEVIDLRLHEGMKWYKIDFYTNIHTDEEWKKIYTEKLAECSLISQNGNDFSFFPISNTGCLFSVTLPGKIN
jgi:hypothetical protein